MVSYLYMIGSDNMIAIISNDALYLTKMDQETFMALAMEKGADCAEIRAASHMQVAKEDVESLIKFFGSKIDEIEFCFCAYGSNNYIMKSVKSIADLNYYKGSDGNLYTCEEAYNYTNAMESDVIEEKASTEVQSLDEVITDATMNPIEKKQTDYQVPGFNPKMVAKHTENLLRVVESAGKNLALINGENGQGIDIPIIVDETDNEPKLTESVKEKADVLDSILKKLSHIEKHIPAKYLDELKRYIRENKKDLRNNFTGEYLKDFNYANLLESDTNGIVLENYLGESTDLLDSIINLPIFSRIIGRKNYTENISKTQLYNQNYVRICPIGIDEDGKVIAMISEITMEPYDVNIINDRVNKTVNKLKKEHKGFSLKAISPKERYELWELEIASYYEEEKPMLYSNNKKTMLVEDYLASSKRFGYYVYPMFDESTDDNQIIWDAYSSLSFDNRCIKDGRALEISKRLEGIEIFPDEVVKQVHEDVDIIDEEKTAAEIAENIRKIMQERVVDTQTPVDIPVIASGSVIELPAKTDSTLKREKESAAKLLDMLARQPITAAAVELNIYDQSGNFVKTVGKDNALGNVVGPVTMGGVNPLEPKSEKGYRDEHGFYWPSKEAYDEEMKEMEDEDSKTR
jgi:hypothetical protein